MDTVLITGTTSGIGAAFAEKFAREETNLILVSRNEAKLQRQQAELQSRYHVSVEYISCDLAEIGAAELIADKVRELGLSVDVLINNAGFNEVGHFIDTRLSKELDMVAGTGLEFAQRPYQAIPESPVPQGFGAFPRPNPYQSIPMGNKLLRENFCHAERLQDTGKRPGTLPASFFDCALSNLHHFFHTIPTQNIDLFGGSHTLPAPGTNQFAGGTGPLAAWGSRSRLGRTAGPRSSWPGGRVLRPIRISFQPLVKAYSTSLSLGRVFHPAAPHW